MNEDSKNEIRFIKFNESWMNLEENYTIFIELSDTTKRPASSSSVDMRCNRKRVKLEKKEEDTDSFFNYDDDDDFTYTFSLKNNRKRNLIEEDEKVQQKLLQTRDKLFEERLSELAPIDAFCFVCTKKAIYMCRDCNRVITYYCRKCVESSCTFLHRVQKMTMAATSIADSRVVDAIPTVWPKLRLLVQTCPYCSRTLKDTSNRRVYAHNITIITKYKRLYPVSVFTSFCEHCNLFVGDRASHHGFTTGQEAQSWIETSFLRHITSLRVEAGLDLTDRGISKSIVHSDLSNRTDMFMCRVDTTSHAGRRSMDLGQALFRELYVYRRMIALHRDDSQISKAIPFGCMACYGGEFRAHADGTSLSLSLSSFFVYNEYSTIILGRMLEAWKHIQWKLWIERVQQGKISGHTR